MGRLRDRRAPARSTSTRSRARAPIEYEVITPEDADGMFDVLTYDKGGSVLRMLERWLGADAFRAGVRHYLERYQFGNTETTDLWDALEAATGKPVRKIMDTWIFQPGFPAIARDGNTLTQKQFTYAGNDADGQLGRAGARPRARRRHGDDDLAPPARRSRRSRRRPPTRSSCSTWAAKASTASLYSEAERDRLLDAGVLEPLERFALLDDLWAAMLAGSATADEFLDVRAPLHAAKPNSSCGGNSRRGCARSAGSSTGDALERLRADVGAIVRPDHGTHRLGRPARRRARPPDSRGSRSACSAGSSATQRPSPGRARSRNAGGGDADLESACVSVVAGAGTADDFERYVRAGDHGRRTRRYNSATSTRSATSPKSRSCCGRPNSRCPTRSAVRTVRSSCSARCATANTVRPRGRSCATTGTRSRAATATR